MPQTPTGAKRPADVIGNAVHVMRVLTGEVPCTTKKAAPKPSKAAKGKPAKLR